MVCTCATGPLGFDDFELRDKAFSGATQGARQGRKLALALRARPWDGGAGTPAALCGQRDSSSVEPFNVTLSGGGLPQL